MNSTNKTTKNLLIYQSDNTFKHEYEKMKDIDNYLKIKRNKNDGKKKHRHYSNFIFFKIIKFKLFHYCYKFINRMIYINNEEKICLLKIDHKYIAQLNIKEYLDLFKLPLADLFSLGVNNIFNLKSDYNAKLINEILMQKIEIEDFDTIIFLFKITFNDWIDLFTYKKDLFTLVNEYNAVNVNYTKIKKNLICVNHLLKEISNFGESDKYFSHFLLYIFNLQRWLYNLKKRNDKKNKK